MPYINEEISEQDYEKYNLEDGTSSDWAIDRERDIWFREFYARVDHEDDLGAEIETEWQFYWKGALISVVTKHMQAPPNPKYAGYRYAYLKLLDIVTTERRRIHAWDDILHNTIPINFPKELEQYKEEMLEELKGGV